MFYEIDVRKYSDKYIKKGREKCQVVIVNTFHSHQNLSSLSNSNQQVEVRWAPVTLITFSVSKRNSKLKRTQIMGWGGCHLYPRSLDLYRPESHILLSF